MSFARYPDSGTLTIAEAGSLNTYGIYAQGESSTVLLPKCRIEMASNRYVIGDAGDRIDIRATVYAPVTGTVIPAGSRIQVNGRSYTVVNTPSRQKFTEIICT